MSGRGIISRDTVSILFREPAMKSISFVLILAVCSSVCQADDDLKERIKDEHARDADHWIYNDIAAGFREAKRTGKPLFVTFRCVPCQDCLSFDGEVASGNDKVKALAAEKFICVRQVEMKGVDLSLFQFDHDLNWAGMFLNADETIYARYGTQSEQGADAYNSVDGLVNTMQHVLKLHAEYPQNKSLLAGKRATQKPWKTALDMPTLHPNLRKGGQTTRSNCIHCHNIHDAEHEYWKQQGTMSHDRLWRYPLPENLGLTVDPQDGRTVRSVAPDSPADRAGVKQGTKLHTVNGQAVSSVADLQWVLHGLPNTDGQNVIIRFEDGSTGRLALQAGWKKTAINWRGSMWSLSPKLRIWMPPLNSFERDEAGLDEDDGAVLVKWINQKEAGGKAAIRAGLRQGDIVILVDGKPIARGRGRFNEFVKLNYKVGDEVAVTILRKGQERVVKLPLVE
ncbi:MAG TPA: PDZ domain-containing protein [Planctomycetes bacterium]|nr:PDZ domain-containing protein [Planctomycetota bacterium]